jgi:hypothetical protein
VLAAFVPLACGADDGIPVFGGRSAAESVLEREMARIDSAAAAIDRIFQPLPVMRPAEEQALRRFTNAQHLARARSLGVARGLSAERLAGLEREGRLVRLESGERFVLRDLDHSQSLAVPGVRAVLAEIGDRFHRRLSTLGAPAFRIEITSVFRTAADQAALRRVNPNAAAGESTHELGATFDILYSAYSAPAEPIVAIDTTRAEGVGAFLRRYADVASERVAGRRSLELQAILGQVLIQMQREGRIMVTLERQQPVFHVTLARQP